MGKQGEGRPLNGDHGMAGLVLVMVACPAAAQQVGPLSTQSLLFDQATHVHQGNYLEAEAGLVYSDNVTLTQGGPSDTLALLGLLGDLSHLGSRLDYRLASDIALVKYLHSDFRTQPSGYLDGSGVLKIVPGFFSWIGRETFNQAVLAPFAPVTPDNLENINYATTGPRFTLRPTLRNTITVEGTYSYINTGSKSPFYVNIDNHRYSADVRFEHAISNASSVYLMGSRESVKFTDVIANTDFTLNQGLVGFRIAGARTTLDLSGGYTKLRVGAQSPTGATWNAQLVRQTSPTQRISLYGWQQVTDAANLYRLNLDQPVPGTVPYRILSSDPLTDREFGATWRFQKGRTFLELALVDFSEHHKLLPAFDRDVKDASAAFVRQLSPVLSWSLAADFAHQSYAAGGSTNTLNAITSLRWQVGQRVGLRFLVAHTSFTTHGSTDNQVGVVAYYALTAAVQAASAVAVPGALPGSPPNAPQPPQ